MNWYMATGLYIFTGFFLYEAWTLKSFEAVIKRHHEQFVDLFGRLFGYRTELGPGIVLLTEIFLTAFLWPFMILSYLLK